MTPDVFISYSPEDQSVADRMCEFLESQDIKCWIAHRDLSPQEPAADGIAEGIAACRSMVLIFSAHSNYSESVRSEVDQAVRAHKVLISFGIEKVAATASMEPYLKHRFAVDAQSGHLEQHLELLVRILKPLTHKLVPKAVHGRTISGTLPAINAGARRAEIPILPSTSDSSGLRISFNFNHIVVVGMPSGFEVRVENHGSAPLRKVEIRLESRGIRHPLAKTWPDLAQDGAACDSFEIEPVRAGHFILRVTARYQEGEKVRVLIGHRSIRVNPTPNSELIGRMTKLLGMPEAVEASSPDAESSQSLGELVGLELPELFEPVELALDHEVSAEAETRAASSASPKIPAEYLALAPAGTVLKLEAIGVSAAIPYQEIRLVARPTFSLGRSREESDLVTWFWPRNEVHDVKTRRISKKHCTFEIRDGEIHLTNTATLGGTMLGDEKAPNSEGLPLGEGGALDLSGVYFLDVTRFTSDAPRAPATDHPTALSGSVRFLPATPHVLPQNSTWLLTDATFGTSRANGVILEIKGLSEIQGRFHYHRGLFWIESFHGEDAVQIDGKIPEPGLMMPLQSAQKIQLGERSFRVVLER